MVKGQDITMTAYPLDALKGLVRPDRVHRDIYEDPAIFELEMERIFGRVWVYIGHESQVQVTSRGETLILGAFLSPEERGRFAEALSDALGKARA